MKELIECVKKNSVTTAIIIIALVVFVYMLYIKKENISIRTNLSIIQI